MPSLFSGINLALQTMLSHQYSILVIEHNVANANTPGYRRQEAVLSAGPAYPPPGFSTGVLAGQLGGGVTIEQIRRFNLDFFDSRYRMEIAQASRWELTHNTLSQVEATLSETSEWGLTALLDAFWAGWQALSTDPTNMATRADLYFRSASLVSGLNDRAIRLDQLRKDQDGLIVQKAEEVNTIAEQIAALNAQIVNVKASGLQPNDLLDERDRLLDRLAELTGAVSSIQNDGQVIVSIGGHALVVGHTSFSLTTSPDPTNNNLAKITWSDGKDFTPPQGELAALLDVRDVQILNQLNGLNTLTSTLITQVNSIHQNGYDLDNNTGNLFFVGTDAISIRISISSDELNRIATSANPDTPGDGSIAAQLAALQYQPLLGPNNSLTLNEFYTNQIGALGISTQNALSNAEAHRLVADNLDYQRESVSGVNLDEEAANLLKTQYAYNAAARLMTVLDEMVDRIINGMGRVGL